MTNDGQNPDEEAQSAPTHSRRLDGYRKDLAIGLAIFVVLLLLWRLMTRPEQLGSLGTWAKTNVFGPEGVQLAQTLGKGGGGPNGVPGGSPSASFATTNETGAGETNPGSAAQAQPQQGEERPHTDDSLLTSNAVKVIATEPAEDAGGTAPLASSPEAARIAGRLGEAGAKGGDIQISLYWQNRNDLDLHCVDPKREEIWFNNKISSRTGGRLDVDANASGGALTSAPVENIFWPVGGAPPGVYEVTVTYYDKHDAVNSTRYVVRTVVRDKTCFFTNTISFPQKQTTHWICKFRYDPSAADPASRCRFLPRS